MINVKDATAEDLYNEFFSLAHDEKLFDVVEDKNQFLQYLFSTNLNNSEGFFYAPANTKYHGNYPGGLYDHSRSVYLRLKDLTEKNNLKWQRQQSPFIVSMFHDLCKCDQYQKADGNPVKLSGNQEIVLAGFHYEYNQNTLLKGHGSKSVMILSQFINLTEEEMLCIRYHMGAYEKEEWQEFDAAVRKYENVLWTHHADQLASKVDDV